MNNGWTRVGHGIEVIGAFEQGQASIAGCRGDWTVQIAKQGHPVHVLDVPAKTKEAAKRQAETALRSYLTQSGAAIGGGLGGVL